MSVIAGSFGRIACQTIWIGAKLFLARSLSRGADELSLKKSKNAVTHPCRSVSVIYPKFFAGGTTIYAAPRQDMKASTFDACG